MLTTNVLFDSDDIVVVDADCRRPAGTGTEESVDDAQIILPRRGSFVRHTAARSVTADAATALLGLPGETQVIDHPHDRGDRCTAIVLRNHAAEEAASAPPNSFAVGSNVLKLHRSLVLEFEVGTLTALGAEEYSLALLDLITFSGRTTDLHTQRATTTVRHDALVDQTRRLLASSVSTPWCLTDIGRAVGSSPFHLARIFRARTGSSISEYLLGLRIEEAADRLRQGENDIAALAVQCGFSDHSHLTKSFKRVVGVTPSAFRRGVRSDVPGRSPDGQTPGF